MLKKQNKNICIVILLLCVRIELYSQDYRMVDKTIPKKTFQEIEYDSLSNIVTNKDVNYFCQFVGQDIVFLPRGEMSDNAPTHYINFEIPKNILVRTDTTWIKKRKKMSHSDYTIKEIRTNKYKAEYVENAWLALCGLSSVQYRKGNEEILPYWHDINRKYPRRYTGYYTPHEYIEGKTFTIHKIESEGDVLTNLIFILSDENGDTLRWVANGFLSGMKVVYPIIVKGYLDKIKKEYIGKDFYITGSKSINRSFQIDKLKGTKFNFKEIVFVRKNNAYCKPSIIASNNSNEIVISLCEVPSIFDYSINSEERLSNMNDIQLEDLDLIEAIEYEKNLLEKELREKERKEQILKKYGKVNGQKILEHKLWIGMTKQMLLDSWGSPLNGINKTVGTFGIHEQWCYSDTYVYIENGIVTSFQD